MEVKISPKNIDEAVKRHEEAFEKELEEMTTKEQQKIILKVKKAVLEQARNNSYVRDTVVQHEYKINNFNNRVATLEEKVRNTENLLVQAIKLLKEKEDHMDKTLYTRFKEYWLFWL